MAFSFISGLWKYRCWVAGLASFITVVSPARRARARSSPCGLRVSSTDGGVSQVLTLAADGELDQAGEDRREDGQDDGEVKDDQLEGSPTGVVVVVRAPAAAEPERVAQEEAGQQGDAADQHADQQREPDVVVAHVRHLMAEDALELLAVELFQQPVVIATHEWSGSRPVAKAFVASSSMMYTAGMGIPAAIDSSWTTL